MQSVTRLLVCILLSVELAGAAISRTAQAGAASAYNDPSVSVSFTGTAGRLVIIGCTRFPDGTAIAAAQFSTSTNLASITLIKTQVVVGAHETALLWARVTANGSTTVTFVPTGTATQYMGCAVAQYSGADTTTPVRVSASVSNYGTTPATGNIAALSGDMLVGIAADGTDRALGTQTGYSSIYSSAGGTYFSMQDAIASGTTNVSWPAMGASSWWDAVGVAIKPNAATPSSPGHRARTF